MPAWCLVRAVIELDIVGLGAWSDHFASIDGLFAGLQGDSWTEKQALKPAMIPPRERRRAPQTVKMAVETMGQAFAQSGLPASAVSVITAASMGDMEITDYMCSTMAENPRLISPTQFHNSVHNAAVGYWSISQSSHAACNAVAAGEYSGPAGLLEAAVLSVDSGSPVLLVIQEGVAPPTIMPLCQSPHPLSLAMLLMPRNNGLSAAALAHVRVHINNQPATWPSLPRKLEQAYSGNPAGKMLPLFAALAHHATAQPGHPFKPPAPESFALPLSVFSCLQVDLTPTKGPST